MGYYCTVPQCTSLAGKTKNVKFHRFPRDITMADKWNVILKRGKPYTKYSKVCSLHFTQGDYNVTTMGQWKTLSKDAVPSQNLPRLHPDGTVMVIRKSRTVKYKEGRKEDHSGEKSDKYVLPSAHTPASAPAPAAPESMASSDALDVSSYRLQTLSAIASNLPPQPANPSQSLHQLKPKKQDAFMQTDPVQSEEDDTQPNNSYSEASETSYTSEQMEFSYRDNQKNFEPKKPYDSPKDYTKPDDYIPQTNEEYNKEAEKYALERKSLNSYEKIETAYHKPASSYQKPESSYQKQESSYQKQESSYLKPESSYQKDSDYHKSVSSDDYSKEAENYALERKQLGVFEKLDIEYPKPALPLENGYQKLPDVYGYQDKEYVGRSEYVGYPNGYPDSAEVLRNQQHNLQMLQVSACDKEYVGRSEYVGYPNGYPDSAEVFRNQQHNLQMLQEQHRVAENQNFFNESPIKQEVVNDDDKFIYERPKDPLDVNSMYGAPRGVMHQQRLLEHLQHQVKQEPDVSVCDSVMPPQGSPYYTANGHNTADYYEPMSRPGPELLIAKQNALAAHTQLWQNSMKRPFFYGDSTHFSTPQILRYTAEDLQEIIEHRTRILQ